ncbi:uncharacterized protein LOC135113225 isoform X4 [Scylla paramamosain]|uniref:uncharacterized protein LOC135113225 isoform X4 n=1 Tax=Scylla paramamosain TaxID=85552 RepID=UPI003082CB73
MASYATYRHVELDRVGVGKKRVNHPPGGKMKLNDEAEPDSRTVRVLKPPGGGSSIVFDEDENMKPIKSKPQPQQQQPQPKEEAPTG